MPKPRVFISHSARNDERARNLLHLLDQRLEREGFEVLLDRKGLEIGDKWEHKIGTWLDRCHAAIVLFTTKALASDYVKYEVANLLHRARDSQQPGEQFLFLPVLVEALSESQFTRFFGTINLQTFQWFGPAADADLIQVLVDRLRPLIAALATSTAEDRLEGHVVAILDRVADRDLLIEVGGRIGVDTQTWTAKRASRQLAEVLVNSPIAVSWQAIRELRPRLGPASTRDLFDLLMPCWASPAAARALDRVTRKEPCTRYVLLSARTTRFTPEMYLARAKLHVGTLEKSVVPVRTDALGVNLEAELLAKVREQLKGPLVLDDPESEIPINLDAALATLEAGAESLVVSLKVDLQLLPAFVAVARAQEFSGVTFLAVTDSTEPPQGMTGLEMLLPLLPPDLETSAYTHYSLYKQKLTA